MSRARTSSLNTVSRKINTTDSRCLVRRQVAVIVANTPAALPAKAATTTIPIVFLTSVDPVEMKLIASLNRPGGNLTGVTVLGVEIGPKQLQLLHEVIPAATTMAVLINPANPATAEAQSMSKSRSVLACRTWAAVRAAA